MTNVFAVPAVQIGNSGRFYDNAGAITVSAPIYANYTGDEGSLALVKKSYADSLSIGSAEWVSSVKSRVAAPPPAPNVGDRHIDLSTNNIITWSGVTWTTLAPTAGLTCLVENEGTPYMYMTPTGGTPGWYSFAVSVDHNDLLNRGTLTHATIDSYLDQHVRVFDVPTFNKLTLARDELIEIQLGFSGIQPSAGDTTVFIGDYTVANGNLTFDMPDGIYLYRGVPDDYDNASCGHMYCCDTGFRIDSLNNNLALYASSVDFHSTGNVNIKGGNIMFVVNDGGSVQFNHVTNIYLFNEDVSLSEEDTGNNLVICPTRDTVFVGGLYVRNRTTVTNQCALSISDSTGNLVVTPTSHVADLHGDLRIMYHADPANYASLAVNSSGDLAATCINFNFSSTDTVHVSGTANADSKTSGSLRCLGGAGISGDCWADRFFAVNNIDTTSIYTPGGVGIGQDCWATNFNASAGVKINNGAALGHYSEYTDFSFAFSAEGIQFSAVVKWVRIGSQVTMSIYQATSCSALLEIVSTDSIPLDYRPSVPCICPISVVKQTYQVVGQAKISTSGIIAVNANDPGEIFGADSGIGTPGVSDASITWLTI